MARIFLSGEIYVAANDRSEVFGSAGAEQVVLLQGVTQADIASTVERVDLPGDISDYTFSSFGASLTIRDGSGNIVATVSDAGGKQIAFSDGALDLSFDTSTFTLSLGGVPLSGTATGITPTQSNIDTNTLSYSSGGTFPSGPNFSLIANSATVNEGQTAVFSLLTSDVPAGTTLNYTITGVSSADIVAPLTGSVTIGSDGIGHISVQTVVDQLAEGTESLLLSLDNGEASADVTVIDTSVAPDNTYTSGLGRNGVFSDYNVEVIFSGSFTQSRKEAFMDAADYLSTIIVGDVQDVGLIDDIRIIANLEAIDGPSGTLGFAGPTELRNLDLLPYEGEMTFDTADVANLEADNTFGDVILHEMTHALGFGTLWELLGLVTSGSDLRFTGDNAIAAYNAEFAGIAGADANSLLGVPVETDGGEGTAGGHWDEDTFFNELMTGYADSANYVSGMSIAALEDMGYDTIFDIANPTATVPQLDDFMSIA